MRRIHSIHYPLFAETTQTLLLVGEEVNGRYVMKFIVTAEKSGNSRSERFKDSKQTYCVLASGERLQNNFIQKGTPIWRISLCTKGTVEFLANYSVQERKAIAILCPLAIANVTCSLDSRISDSVFAQTTGTPDLRDSHDEKI